MITIPYYLFFILLLNCVLFLSGCVRYESLTYVDSSVDVESSALFDVNEVGARYLEIIRITEDGKRIKIFRRTKTGVFASHEYPKSDTGILNAFQLTPGKYWIRYTLIYGAHKGVDIVRNPKYHPTEAGYVTLKAGHRYKLKRKHCTYDLFCLSKSMSTSWIEDLETGEVILGTSDMNRAPRDDCEKIDTYQKYYCPWWYGQ